MNFFVFGCSLTFFSTFCLLPSPLSLSLSPPPLSLYLSRSLLPSAHSSSFLPLCLPTLSLNPLCFLISLQLSSLCRCPLYLSSLTSSCDRNLWQKTFPNAIYHQKKLNKQFVKHKSWWASNLIFQTKIVVANIKLDQNDSYSSHIVLFEVIYDF